MAPSPPAVPPALSFPASVLRWLSGDVLEAMGAIVMLACLAALLGACARRACLRWRWSQRRRKVGSVVDVSPAEARYGPTAANHDELVRNAEASTSVSRARSAEGRDSSEWRAPRPPPPAPSSEVTVPVAGAEDDGEEEPTAATCSTSDGPPKPPTPFLLRPLHRPPPPPPLLPAHPSCRTYTYTSGSGGHGSRLPVPVPGPVPGREGTRPRLPPGLASSQQTLRSIN